MTNFWDANTLIDYGFLLHTVKGDDKVYKVNLINDNGNKNYTVNSIALSHPPLNKVKHLQYLKRLDFFCPTYDLLCRYKKNRDWESYTEDYYNILKKRKRDIREWLEDLKPNHVYFLCCWENTIAGSNCHRSLIYKKILSSKIAMETVLPIYRHGEKIYKEEREGKIEISMPTGLPSYFSSLDESLIGIDESSDGDSSYISIVNSNGEVVSRVRGH